ncbi:MAG TPA: ATP-binding protein [Thermomicrobiales bacterium]|nr:ATP-binding protein [Thermomicrobiales bacterium]
MGNDHSCRGRIVADVDVERIRRQARALATHTGFGRHDAEAIRIAVSELATNLLRYAPGGELVVSVVSGANRVGILIQSSDPGPGIADVELALRDGYSTSGGLGSGLPGVCRLMDDFAIVSSPSGTSIEARKWLPSPSPSR